MLSKTTEYALRAVLYLAKAGDNNTTAQSIAAATIVPEGYMSKVLNTLTRAGVITSRRGPTGGFSLAIDPEKLTMLEVVEAVEPLPRIKTCPLDIAEHDGALCPLHAVLAELVDGIDEKLRSTTIGDLLNKQIQPLGDIPRCDFPPSPKKPAE